MKPQIGCNLKNKCLSADLHIYSCLQTFIVLGQPLFLAIISHSIFMNKVRNLPTLLLHSSVVKLQNTLTQKVPYTVQIAELPRDWSAWSGDIRIGICLQPSLSIYTLMMTLISHNLMYLKIKHLVQTRLLP